MLKLKMPRCQRRWMNLGAGLGLGLLVALPTAAQAATTYSTVFTFDISLTSGGVVASGNDLYGVITNRSLTVGGAIYRVSQSGGAPETIYQLTNDDGYTPIAGLLAGSDGYLYGSTHYAERVSTNITNGVGTLFRLRTDGTGFQKLHTFDASSTTETQTIGNQSVSLVKNADGMFPSYALIEDASSGYLYGATTVGGSNGTGVVFRIKRDGTEALQVIHEFAALNTDGTSTEGAYPSGPLMLGSDGRLYGATSGGGSNLYTLTTISSSATTVTTKGAGTVFSMNADGTGFQTVYSFPALSDTTDSDSDTSDLLGENTYGAFPIGGLTEVSPGVLVGVTADGGITADADTGGLGTIFELTTSGSPSLLHNFEEDTGYETKGSLVLSSVDGRLYGVNYSGSSTVTPALSVGSVFSIDPTNPVDDYQVEHAFTTTEGAFPEAGLTQAANGELFGTTMAGGACTTSYGSYGAVYRLSFTGTSASGYANCTTYDSGGGSFGAGLLMLLSILGLTPVRRWVQDLSSPV